MSVLGKVTETREIKKVGLLVHVWSWLNVEREIKKRKTRNMEHKRDS